MSGMRRVHPPPAPLGLRPSLPPRQCPASGLRACPPPFPPPHLFATSSSRVQARCHSGATLPAPLTVCSLFLCPLGTKPRRTGTAVAPLPSASRSPAQGLQAEGTEKVRPTQPKALAASGPSQGQRVECRPGRRVHRGHSESPRGGTGAEGPRWEQWCGSRGSCSTATGSEDPRGPGHPAGFRALAQWLAASILDVAPSTRNFRTWRVGLRCQGWRRDGGGCSWGWGFLLG